MAMTDGGPAFPMCQWCSSERFRKQGRIWLCKKHYRFQQMRVRAKSDGKAVPSYVDLQSMLDALPAYMECPHCRRKMNWLSKEGTQTVITLQHYRDGQMGLICLSCNTRHAAMPDDSFVDLPSGHKLCPSCGKVKPHSDFYKDNSRYMSVKTYCKECAYGKFRNWVANNRDYYNHMQRVYRKGSRAV